MGDAYRGLTIRIGADAQPLTRVLSSITSAARATSREVGKIGAALKRDPGNYSLAETQIKRLGDQSKLSAHEIAIMGTALNEALSVHKGGAGNLSYILKNAESDAANARRRFNTLDQTLEKVKDSIISYNVAERGMTSEDATAALRKLQREAKNSGNEIEFLERELRKVWSSNKSLIPFDTKSIDEAIAKWKELRAEHGAVQRQLETANRNVGIKNMAVQIELARSELKQMRIEAINASNAMAQIGTSQGAREAANKTRMLSESVKEAEAHFRSMIGITKALPKDIEAATMQTRSFQQVAMLLENKIKTLQERLKTLDGGKVGKIEAEFITTGNAVRVLTDEAAGFEAEITQCQAKLTVLEEKLQALIPGSKAFQKIEGEISEVNAKLRTAEDHLATTNVRLRQANDAHAFRTVQSEIAGANGQLATHNAQLAAAKKKWGQMGSAMRTAGYSMMATLGSTAMIGGMYAVQAATDIDSAYRNMRKTVNGTEEQFEQLRKAALAFSQTHFTSADQILEIEAIGGQLGIQVQNLQKFSEVVSNTDIATNLDIETISQNLGQLSNIMNDMNQDLQSGPGSMEAYSDSLVRLGNNTAAQEDKIQNVMMRIASMGTICGMTTPDLLALASATAATGQGAEAAGTALSKTFSGIESAVNGSERALSKLQNSTGLTEEEIESLTAEIEKGQVKLEKFAEVAGMSADDFKRAWNESPMEAFKAFIQGLKNIDASGGSVDSTLTKLGITSVRQKQTLQGLTQTVGILDNALTMSNDAWNGVSDQWGAAGDAAREAQRKSEGFSGQLEMIKNNFKVLASVFLESLTPTLVSATDVVRGLVDGFKELPDVAKQIIVGATALTALAGPIAIIAGTSIQAGSSIKGFVTGQKQGWTVAKTALENGADALLYTSTALDRHGNAIAKNGKLVDRMGGKLVNVGAKVEAFGNKNLKAGGMVSKLGTGVGNLGIAMSSATIPAGALAAIIGVLGGAVVGSAMYVDSLTAKTKAAKEANEKLADSSTKLASTAERAFAQMGGSIGSSLTVSLDEALESYKTFAEKVSSSKLDLASSAEDMATKVLAIKESSKDAISLMDKLRDSGSLTELEYEQLSLSIDKYNQTTNDSIQLTRDEDGNIRVLRDGVDLTADSFLGLAQAQETAAKASYFKDAYNTAFDNEMEAQKQVQTLTKAYDDAKAAREGFEANMKPDLTAPAEAWQDYYKQLAHLEDRENSAKTAMDGANTSLDEAANSARAASEMYSLLSSDAAKAAGTFENIIASNTDAMAAFNATGNSVFDFKTILEKANVPLDKFSKQDIAKIVREWDGSMPSLINTLNTLGLVTEEDAQALRELNLITIDDKHYYVGSDGTVYDEKGKLQELQDFTIDGKKLFITTEGLITAEGELYKFDELELDPKEFEVDDDGTVRVAEDKVDGLKRSLEKLPSRVDIHVTATDDASKVIANIRHAFETGTLSSNITGGQGLKQGGHASGGFVRLHAAGAFITNGTTYIGTDARGVRHIAGEAGREFVQHHADGTTSIIPIQNRKYMAPFVAAVAEMLPEYGGVSREDLYKAADAVVRSNRQQGDIVLVLDDREIGRVVRRFAS